MYNIRDIILEKNKEIEGNRNINLYTKYKKEQRISISQIKDSLAVEFDREGVAKKTHDLHFDDEQSIYYQKSIDEILDMWDVKAESSKRMGNLVDDFIGLEYSHWDHEDKKSTELAENLYESAGPIIKRKYQGIRAVLSEFKKNRLHFECRELPLYLPYIYKKKIYLINGRFDAIFSTDSQLLIVDWKNSEEIKESNKWQKMFGPLKDYDDCDLIKFTVQVYMYIYILKETYGITLPMSSCIVQFPGQQDFYYKIFKPGFEYSPELMKKIIEYSIETRIKSQKELKKKEKAK